MRKFSGIIHAIAGFVRAHGRAPLLLCMAMIGALSGAPLWAGSGPSEQNQAAEEYPLGPDSQRQPGVPQGTVTHFTWTSKIFPGTTRDYWVYVPAQYNSAKPACVMIFQDGEWFMQENNRMRIPIVFDNLIAKGEMPVTIAIFINPGVLKALSPTQQDRFNRSFEYDALGDTYARFLIEEILPEVGKHWNLSKNPDDRAIAGLSSGGICAFNAAWNRPDAFHRVMSFIGSFADLRGGDIYPALIRKTEPKPLRVFLQDGSSDLNLFAGDWWLANQTMASALKWAGYDVKFTTGDKDHDMIQGGAILPDAMRWLWRDYPAPIAKPAPNGTGERSIPILDPKGAWEAASPAPPIPDSDKFNEELWPPAKDWATGLAANSKGDVFFGNAIEGRIEDVEAQGEFSILTRNSNGLRSLAFGPDGRLYACEGKSKRIVAYPASGEGQIIAKDIDCQDLAVAHNGGVYFTDQATGGVKYVNAHGDVESASSSMTRYNGVKLSLDQSLLFVSSRNSRWISSLQVQPGGSLANDEDFFRLESPDQSTWTGAAGMAVDTEGFLYVATRLGIQVSDQPGRIVLIIDSPVLGHQPSGVTFGGPDFEYLYTVVDGRIYRRHMLRKGVPPGTVLKPPTPRL